MSPLIAIVLLSLSVFIPFLFSLTSLVAYLPQLVALFSILFIVFYRLRLPVAYLVSFIVCLVVFSTHGLNSPFLFMIYFLVFIIALLFSPLVSLSASLIITILLSQSLNSLSSLIPLLSLVFITPIVWIISRQSQSQAKTATTIAIEETDFLFWLNLKFKTGITTIVDLSSQLLSTPTTPNQKDQLKKIRSSAKNLLNSAEKLSSDLDQTLDDEI